jgi:hypothetical protein
MQVHVHFVGFRTDSQYWAAVRVWGKPDFVHKWHDHRMYGDVGEHDILVFANKETPDFVHAYTWQDHELW